MCLYVPWFCCRGSACIYNFFNWPPFCCSSIGRIFLSFSLCAITPVYYCVISFYLPLHNICGFILIPWSGTLWFQKKGNPYYSNAQNHRIATRDVPESSHIKSEGPKLASMIISYALAQYDFFPSRSSNYRFMRESYMWWNYNTSMSMVSKWRNKNAVVVKLKQITQWQGVAIVDNENDKNNILNPSIHVYK